MLALSNLSIFILFLFIPEGVKLLSDPESVVALVQSVREEVVEDEEGEEGEPALVGAEESSEEA